MDDPTVGTARASARPASTSSGSRRASPDEARAGLERLRARLAALEEAPADPEASFARSPGEAAAALDTIEPDDRLVVFVGKLIASKGVELLLAAWPLVLAREPRARLLIVGFGAFRAGSRAARRATSRPATSRPRAALRGEDGGELPQLAAFLDALEDAGRPTAPRRAA